MQQQTPAGRGSASDLSFAVDPGELDTFVEGVRRLETTMATHVRTFESLHLDSDVFGRLPGISKKVYRAYSNHVEEGVKAFDEGKAVLNSAGRRGEETAVAYREVEQRNIGGVKEISTLLAVSEARPAVRADVREA